MRSITAFTHLKCWIKEEFFALRPFQPCSWTRKEMKPILKEKEKRQNNGIVSWINGGRPLPEQVRSWESPRLQNRPAHRKIPQNKTLANHFPIEAKRTTGTRDASKRDQE